MTYKGIATDGKPYPVCRADCQRCGRAGLPILLVRPSVVDKRTAGIIRHASPGYMQTLDASFSAIKREGTAPVNRLLCKWYVYVYYQTRNTWDVWRSHDDGTFLKLLELATAEQYAQSGEKLAPSEALSMCSRGAANIPTGLITLLWAETQPDIWIGFSHHAWHADVLKDYGTDKNGVRKLRMAHVNGQALINQGTVPQTGRVLDKGTLEASIPEFYPTAIGAAEAKSHPMVQAFERSEVGLDISRFGKAEVLADVVRKMEAAAGASAAGKGLVLMVPDPVGVASEHNTIRMGVVDQRQAWVEGGVDSTGANADPDRPWKRQSLLGAAAIRDSLKQQRLALLKDLTKNGAYKASITISEQEYLKVEKLEKAGKKTYPEGTLYERIDTKPVVYRVSWPDDAIDQGLGGVAASAVESKIRRYDNHLRWNDIEAATKAWGIKEIEWRTTQDERDKDFVEWLGMESLHTALLYDYAEKAVLTEHTKKSAVFKADLDNAMSKISAVARCFSGGVCGDASLEYFVSMFKKDEGDPTHWIANPIFKSLSLFEVVAADPGAQASIYDLFTGLYGASVPLLRKAWGSFSKAEELNLSAILLVATNITNKLRELTLYAKGSKQPLIEPEVAQAKQVRWVRAAAIIEFVKSEKKFYLLGLNLQVQTTPASMPIGSPPAGPGPRVSQTVNSANESAPRMSQSISTHYYAKGLTVLDHGTVYAVFVGGGLEDVQRVSVKTSTIDAVSHDSLGRPPSMRVPVDVAEAMVREPAQSFASQIQTATEDNIEPSQRIPALFAVVAFIMHSRAVWKSLDDLKDARGLRRLEAMAGLLSATLGISAAFIELAGILMESRAAGKAAMSFSAGARLPNTLKFLGGVVAGGAAFADCVNAFVKGIGAQRQGDSDAASALYLQGLLMVGGGSFYASGLALELVLANLLRTGVSQLAIRLVASATVWTGGIGLALCLIGIGVSVLALTLIDDMYEIWLDRSYFGKHERTEGRFTSMEQEVIAFGALMRGVSVFWDTELMGDGVGITIKVPAPKQGFRATYRLDGFSSRDSSAVVTETLHTGDAVYSESDKTKNWDIKFEASPNLPATHALRLEFEIKNEAAVIANDSIWITK